MEYLKLQRSFRESDAWMAADVHARGAWTSVAGFCADEENSGRIVGAKAWIDRLWLLRAGCGLACIEHMIASHLAAWDGDDLVVAGYDIIGQQHYQAKRKVARDAGVASGASRRAATARKFRGSTGHEAHGEPHDEPHGSPMRSTAGEARGEASGEPHGSTTTEQHAQPDGEPPAEPQVEPSIHSPVTSNQEDDDSRAHAPPRDPRIVVVVAHGAAMVDKDGNDQTERWLDCMGDATVAECEDVMRSAPRILGHPLRFQGKFQTVLKRVREANAAERDAAQAEAREAAKRRRATRLALIVKAIDAHLASPEGTELAAAIERKPSERDLLRDARGGNATALEYLCRHHAVLQDLADDTLTAEVA